MPEDSSKKGNWDLLQKIGIPIILFLATATLGTLLFGRLNRIEDRMINMIERVARIEEAVVGISKEIGSLKISIVDNYEGVESRVRELEKKVF